MVRSEIAALHDRIAHLEQQAARLANLPGLPEGWTVETIKPFAGISEVTQPECRRLSQIFSETKTMTCGEFQFLLKLLSTCYPPAPGQEGEKE